MIDVSKGKSIEDTAVHHERLSDKELEEKIEEIKSKNKDAPEGKLIGIAMSQLRGRADPGKVMQMIKKK